jgi:chromatin remodeling complex protein RSC6
MARVSKSDKPSKTTTEPTPEPVSEVKEAKEIKPKTQRVKKEQASTPSPAPAPAPVAPVVEPVAEVVAETVHEEPAEFKELAEQSAEFLTKLNNWVSVGSALKSEFKALDKRWGRELKNALKSKKRGKRGGNKSPSGFVKPTKISDELAAFLNKPNESEMARTEVTKEINKYIKNNKLQNPENGRHILADEKLSALLKLSPGDELTYFNLQKFMSPHFPKTAVKVSKVTA